MSYALDAYLVCNVAIAPGKLIAYKRHIETKGNDTMSKDQIKDLKELVAKCHKLGGSILLDYADYLEDNVCKLKLADGQETTQLEYDARKRWNAKCN
jgi:hypothetical protein